jgi:hypothetical protein
LNYGDTKFWALLNNYGKGNIIKSIDLIFSLILTTTFVFIVLYLNHLEVTINIICPQFITVSSALIAVIIAGLAIVVSISDDNFILMLKNVKVYEKILFLFYYDIILLGCSIVSNAIAYLTPNIVTLNIIINGIQIETAFFMVLLWLATFLGLYSLFSVILLVGTIMRYGLYRGAFIEINN